MAPSNVFSYLRPHHKRTNSQPSTPEPPHSANSVQSPTQAAHFQDVFANPPRLLHDNASSHSNSPVSPFPPVLPPIPRVASRANPPEPQKQLPKSAKELPPSNKEQHGMTAAQIGALLGPDGSALAQSSPDSVLPADVWRDTARRPNSAASSAHTGLRVKGQRPAAYSSHSADQSSTYTTAESSTSISMPSSSPFMSQTSLASSFPPPAEKQPGSGKGSSSGQHGKGSRKSFNLRNPMSLLLRRRSGQTLANLSEESLVSHRSQVVPAMALDFDPSIRGNIVHDFSAPKTRRTHSYDVNAYGPDRRTDGEARLQADDESPSKRDRSHTPVFKEEFDSTDADDKKRESAIRAETLANQDFLARNAFPEQPDHAPPPVPPFGKRRSIPVPLQLNNDAAGLAPVPEASPSPPADSDSNRSSTVKTPPQSRSRAVSGADANFQPAGLPAHLTSRASRFSFQIAGVNSSEQERLLEERHKQKAAAKAKESAENKTAGDNGYGYEEDDMYDYDDMHDGGFEEDIPMVGDDYGDGFGGFYSDTGLAQGLTAYDFSSLNSGIPYNNPLSPIPGSDTMGTPADVRDNALSAAMLQGLAQAQQLSTLNGPPTNESQQPGVDIQGLGVGDVGDGVGGEGETSLDPEASPALPQEPPAKGLVLEDDDFYFDDGLVDEPTPEHGEKFDESAFDDPSSELYERPVPAVKLPQDATSTEITCAMDEDADHHEEQEPSKHALAPHPSMKQLGRELQSGDPFDFKSPADYFSALAEAANKAEADGRFVRKNSVMTTNTDVSVYSQDDNNEQANASNTVNRESSETAPSLVPDSGRVSGGAEIFPPDTFNGDTYGSFEPAFGDSPYNDPYEADYGDDYGDYDSALEDDPMIAAANAEALANDFDGEYGREFGFYANAYSTGTEAVNGGYFGPSSLGRSVSGRNAVREPNLTPITERSEYSTRNSFIGIGHFGGQGNSAGALPSPGLAQLARMSPYGFPPGSEDEFSDYDMSLEQLMKLRKGAFGGGTGSAGGGSAASSPRRNSSPLSFFPGSFPRGTSPVAVRSKSTWDAMQEIDERASDSDAVNVGVLQVQNNAQDENNEDEDEALVNEINGAEYDSGSETSAPGDDEESSSHDYTGFTIINPRPAPSVAPSRPPPPPPQKPNIPHQIQTSNINNNHYAYDTFMPDHPGNIPISVPTSAISTTSSSSLPFGHSASASTASATLPASANSSAAATTNTAATGATLLSLAGSSGAAAGLGVGASAGAGSMGIGVGVASPASPPILSPTSPTHPVFSPASPTHPVFGPTSPTHPVLLSPVSPLGPGPMVSSPLSPTAAERRGHSRTGSASADSVTYVRERIEVPDDHAPGGKGRPAGRGEGFGDSVSGGEGYFGGGEGSYGKGEEGCGSARTGRGGGRAEYRWVLERRRTASTGELELVGREVVEGGRI